VIRVALDTSTAVGSVALGDGARLLAATELAVQSRHAEALVPALDALLARAGVTRAEIGEVVVGAGPGSFTGVRVAAATAKGLVAGLGVPLLAYSSLLALAVGVARRAAPGSEAARPVCALFDARRGEAYGGCWRVGEGGIETVMEPTVGPVAELVAAVRGADPVLAGDPAFGGLVVLDAAPHARDLLWLAEHHPSAGAVGDASAWQPLYVRGSSATP
jgi:tRNA threonylcarbamoyladenosine biosynthesis protein TsaB